MIELRKRKDVQIKLNAHLFGDSNPFKNPEIKRKAQDALREGGYWMLSGGNGTGPTRSQALLLAALGHEWILEYAVPTKETSGSGYPSSYKIDLCHPNKKLAIEIHGNSHRAKKVQERDKKKKEKLESLGWTVVAYWNNEIYNELDRVVAEVEEWLLNTAGP